MPYATTTLGDATADLAARLADPTFVRWTQAELSDLIREAIRTFNALTGHFRDQAVFSTVDSEPFYDLATTNPLLRGYTVTDQDLVGMIQAHLLEPVSPTVWTGTDQFTLADVTSAIQGRRDSFLRETGIVLTRTTPVVGPSMGGRIPLDEHIVTVRRVAFRNTDGVTTPLHREDVWSFNHFAQRWPQLPGRPPLMPLGFSVGETPPLVMQIVPPLSDVGILDLISVERGTLLNPATPVVLGIPDDFAWVVKFGALSDLLSKDGLATDTARSDYCEQRWTQGIEMAKGSSVILAARVNDVPIQIGSLAEADDFLSTWQNGTGQPLTLLVTSGTLLGLTPVPDLPVPGAYSITLDIVRNAPVPATLADFLQVGPELLDGIIDYSEHLALFKDGFAAVKATEGLLERFYGMAGVQFQLETADSPTRDALMNQGRRDEEHTARVEAR